MFANASARTAWEPPLIFKGVVGLYIQDSFASAYGWRLESICYLIWVWWGFVSERLSVCFMNSGGEGGGRVKS